MTNSTKYQAFGALVPLITTFVAGSYIQNYFSHIGVALGNISTFTSLVSVVQIIIMIVNAFAIDRIKRIVGVMIALVGGAALGCGIISPLCLSLTLSVGMVFMLIAGISLVVNILMGLINVLTFKFAYLAIDMDGYGKAINNITIINGILAIIIGMVVSWAAAIRDFSYVMAAGLLLCVIIGVICMILIATIKPIAQNVAVSEEKKEKFSFSVLKEYEFTYFYIPNLIRGLAMSAINVMPLIFIKNITSNPEAVSMLVNIMSVSAILGCMIYRIVGKKIKTSSVYFVSSIVMFIFMPLLLAGYNVTIFYVGYFVLGIFFNINSVAATIYPSEYVSFNSIGTYTSVRLIILTMGQALGAYIIGLLIDSVPSIIILTVCALFQLASGIMFKRFQKKT